ncbi:MAG: adenylate/guanylate cyclase domain-containing protein [Pseudomonadota bacterium]
MVARQSFASRLIAESDAQSEALIGGVRMFVAGVLFVTVVALLFRLPLNVFLLRQTELQAAVVVTLLYFVLGLTSFLLVRLGHYKPIYGLTFALLEVALVLANIFFDVRDFETSSLFALASPLILMVTLVLVLQVLRYRLVVHVVASTLLLSGILVLLTFDMRVGQPATPRVLAELQQMYSLPPNLVRVLMLCVLATIVGLAIWRSRRMMETIAQELEAAHNRNRFLPRELTNRLDDAELAKLREGQEREVVVMFVDLRGYTALSQTISPSQTADLLSRYRSLVSGCISQNDGIVDKFIGDGVMCFFGLKCSPEEAAAQSAAAALAVHRSIADWNEERRAAGSAVLDTAIAVAAGPVLVAALGDEQRLEFTVVGPAVNTASRIESFAKEIGQRTVIDARVFSLLEKWPDKQKTGLRLDNLGKHTLRGERRSGSLYTLRQR